MAIPEGWVELGSLEECKTPVRIFESAATKLRVCLIAAEGPLVNGYFALATEAFDNDYAHRDDGLPHTLEHLVFLGSEEVCCARERHRHRLRLPPLPPLLPLPPPSPPGAIAPAVAADPPPNAQYPFKGVLDKLANRCLAQVSGLLLPLLVVLLLLALLLLLPPLNACTSYMRQGTNAWTDVDHTAYTITTAGSEGFLNLLPIYMDHVLFPTLLDSSFTTEIHHVTAEGDDKGVVYCEMQARLLKDPCRAFLKQLPAADTYSRGARTGPPRWWTARAWTCCTPAPSAATTPRRGARCCSCAPLPTTRCDGRCC